MEMGGEAFVGCAVASQWLNQAVTFIEADGLGRVSHPLFSTQPPPPRSQAGTPPRMPTPGQYCVPGVQMVALSIVCHRKVPP